MKRWIKVLGSLVGAVLLATAVVGTAFAQGPVADGDGVPDLVGDGSGAKGGAAYGFVDEDGDGINDRYLSTPEFVDENDDGICDICGGVPGEGEYLQNNTARTNASPFGASGKHTECSFAEVTVVLASAAPG